MARIKELWTSTRIVHGRLRHPEDQGSVERANKDFKLMLYARLKELMPTSSIPADTNDTSYDMSVPPPIGSTVTPYFDLPTGISRQVVPTLPYVQLLTDASHSSPAEEADDFHYEEELQCTSCPDIFLTAGCMARVDAFGITGVQYFCELDENCRRTLTAARTRRSAWLALTKQGQDMLKSSHKRTKLLEVGDNVRIPIPSLTGPLSASLVGAVLGVSSTGNTLQLGTKHGRISSRFSLSEVSPCGSNLLLTPVDVPDAELSVRTAAVALGYFIVGKGTDIYIYF